ncbi:Hypothetical protein ETEE_2932 [Edwardsiella anguillarum ET080813]|uniref:Uncharacterized protein n=1 Tax=Edwardsiella anguillarum ET080813 TaxID=667120 RepID=A0A076LS38_9GAMM|nr:Hypothetical protein ETEE_2932 [Edwardsiella anguillarum ET080813]
MPGTDFHIISLPLQRREACDGGFSRRGVASAGRSEDIVFTALIIRIYLGLKADYT